MDYGQLDKSKTKGPVQCLRWLGDLERIDKEMI